MKRNHWCAQWVRSLPFLMLFGVLTKLLLLSPPAATGKPKDGNAVTSWNTVAIATVLVDPGRILDSRALATTHAAIHDAVNAIDRRYQPYVADLWAPGASLDAAVAAAAHDVLVVLSPSQRSNLDAAYAAALSEIPDGPAKANGVSIGQRAAQLNLDNRSQDGAATASQPVYIPTKQPGDYDFTPPSTIALLPSWGKVQTWGIDLAKHQVPGPDPLRSVQYALDFNYLKAIGRVDSTWRTAEQTEIALFWAEGAPAKWNRIANSVIVEKKLDPWEAARILALVNFASADGFIASFDAKYHFRFWRPSTAIQRGDEDGNALTLGEPTWRPLFSAAPYLQPPIPDYPSNHSVVGAAAAAVLEHFFGEHVHFNTTSTSLPNVIRSFHGFNQAAVENGLSRAYAGIHFLRAILDGYVQGRGIGLKIAKLLPSAH